MNVIQKQIHCMTGISLTGKVDQSLTGLCTGRRVRGKLEAELGSALLQTGP